MKLIFYGYLADIMGRELQFEGGASCTIAQLRERIIAEHHYVQEALSNERVRACVANMLVDEGYVVEATDTIEFLPPLSGG